VARRARIILACAEGHTNKAVAKRLRTSQVTVCKWRARFIADRLDGLYDEPRPGTPRTVTDEQIEHGRIAFLSPLEPRQLAASFSPRCSAAKNRRSGLPPANVHPINELATYVHFARADPTLPSHRTILAR
jgi:hypothetical protein